MEKKLYRDEHRKVIAGVCAGLADYLNLDITLVRIIFVIAGILKGTGLVVYVILWIVLPKKNYLFTDPTVDYTVPPVPPSSSSPFAEPFMNMPPMAPLQPKRNSGAAIVAGVIMITLGVLFLLNQLNIMVNLHFRMLWPIVLVVAGLAIMFTGKKEEGWKKFDKKEDGTIDPLNDNPPTEQL